MESPGGRRVPPATNHGATIDTEAATAVLERIAIEPPWDLACRMAGAVLKSPYRVNARSV